MHTNLVHQLLKYPPHNFLPDKGNPLGLYCQYDLLKTVLENHRSIIANQGHPQQKWTGVKAQECWSESSQQLDHIAETGNFLDTHTHQSKHVLGNKTLQTIKNLGIKRHQLYPMGLGSTISKFVPHHWSHSPWISRKNTALPIHRRLGSGIS